MKKLISVILKALITIVAILILALVILLTVVSIKEYKPDEWEQLEIDRSASPEEVLLVGDRIKVISWNVGCGTLGDNADFFMDYGEMVYTADKERVAANIDGIIGSLTEIGPDIMLLQETDINSARSYHTDERELISNAFPGFDDTFAYNFNVDFVPYPIPFTLRYRFSRKDSASLSLQMAGQMCEPEKMSFGKQDSH